MNEKFLQPGDIYFSQEECRITTILGSCVAVAIYDLEKQIGGLCHYYLPRLTPDNNSDKPHKYAESAIPDLLKQFKSAGSNPKNLVAKIVGGAFMHDQAKAVGIQNAGIARSLLKNFGIKVVAEAVGGSVGRTIRFNTKTGQLELKNHPEIAANEQSDKDENRKIKILIVDDSKSMRVILRKMIETSERLEVIGEAESAFAAKKFMAENKPDVITLDINMPGMDGVTFLKSYMNTNPVPTIMISALNKEDSGPVFDALENGAFHYIKKPELSEIETMQSELQEICIAADKFRYHEHHNSMAHGRITKNDLQLSKLLIAIGASTGGTEAIKDLITMLPANIPPMVITQHIPPVFSAAFAERLNRLCRFTVKEAADGDVLKPGHCFVAPGGKHIRIKNLNGQKHIYLSDEPPVNRFKPSVDYMFNSIAAGDCRNIAAVILTGMGADGARGMVNLKRRGAYTVAQDEATSVVYGMPKVAKDLGGATEVVALNKIADKLIEYINNCK